MRLLDLFAGIGGFSLAAHWLGWETAAFVEWDGFCQKVLKKNFPNVPVYGDIKQFDGTQYTGTVDIISGGFPCQPFSSAGKRQGAADDRYLWPEMLRVIREIQPTWIVGENVNGLLSMDGGAVFEEICASLEGEGYAVQPFIIPACGKGAPHRRDRVWIVAKNTERNGRKRNGCKESAGVRKFGNAFSGNGIGVCVKSDRLTPHTPRQQTQPTEQGGLHAESGREAGDVADAEGQRWNKGARRPERLHADAREINWSRSWLQVATELCGIFNGFSRELDQNRLKNAEIKKRITGQDLPCLWQIFQQKAFQWEIRGRDKVFNPEYLFAVLWKYFSESNRQDNLLFESAEVQDAFLRNVWYGSKTGCPSQGWRYNEQYKREHSDALSQLSHEIALATMEAEETYKKDRTNRLKALGNSIVPQIAYEIFKAIQETENSPI